jgi:hypothetical protein
LTPRREFRTRREGRTVEGAGEGRAKRIVEMRGGSATMRKMSSASSAPSFPAAMYSRMNAWASLHGFALGHAEVDQVFGFIGYIIQE